MPCSAAREDTGGLDGLYLEQGQVEKQTCAFGNGFRAT